MTTGTKAPPMKLPPILADLDLKLGRALNVPVRAIWPEPEKFTAADCPEAIAKVLIHSSHVHARLSSAKISYLFRPEIVTGGMEKASTSSRASGKLAYLTGLDFVIEVNHKAWLALTPEQRLAVVDHALTACDRDPDTSAYLIRPFDVQEYSEVVARWGLYTMPLRGFGYAVERAQIDLFEGTAVGLVEQAAPAIAAAVKGAIKETAKGKKKVNDDAGTFELEDDDDE